MAADVVTTTCRRDRSTFSLSWAKTKDKRQETKTDRCILEEADACSKELFWMSRRWSGAQGYQNKEFQKKEAVGFEICASDELKQGIIITLLRRLEQQRL